MNLPEQGGSPSEAEQLRALIERQRALLGVPPMEEQYKRIEAGQTPINPLEAFGMVARPIESVTAAPTRAGAKALSEGQGLTGFVEAFREQMGKPPETAPSGEELAKTVVPYGASPKLLGIGLDVALDPMNVVNPALAGMAAMAGLKKVGRAAEVAQEAARLAPQDALGFYSKLERLMIEKMGKSATPEQVMSIAQGAKQEEVAASQLADFLRGKQSVSKEDVLGQIRETRPQLIEKTLGGEANTWQSKSPFYQIPEVKRIVDSSNNRNEMKILLANDGDAYRALFKKFPEEMKNENWANYIIEDILEKRRNSISAPKYHSYVEPGGKNYREILLALPEKSAVKNIQIKPSTSGIEGDLDVIDEAGRIIYTANGPTEATEFIQELEYVRNKDLKTNKQNFYSGHWDDPNVLAHARVNDRVDETGNKLFHVEEIQSDWHQKGREVGYKGEKNPQKFFGIDPDAWAGMTPEVKATYEKEMLDHPDFISGRNLPPDAPFKKSWMELMAKRMVRQAVDSGADRLSWTPGAKQAARYDLSKQIESIGYNGTDLKAWDHSGKRVIEQTGVRREDLPNYIGKEAAEKLLKNKRIDGNYTLSGQELEVGGEGMKAFYDKMLPDFLRKLGKKYGAEVGETTTSGMKVPYLELTPKLKEAIKKEGQELFNVAGPVGAGALLKDYVDKNRQD